MILVVLVTINDWIMIIILMNDYYTPLLLYVTWISVHI